MILIDSAVGSGFEMRKGKKHASDLVGPLRVKVQCKVRVETLPSGDIAFDGFGPDNDTVMIGIERKQVAELMGSIRSGRYSGDQLIRMRQHYDLVYLIVEGIYQPNTNGILMVPMRGGWKPLMNGKQVYPYSELDKFIVSIEATKGVIVLHSSNAGETVQMIANRYSWWQKDWDEHQAGEALKTQVGIGIKKPTMCRMLAKELPGVGWTRSKELAEHFGSFGKLVSATVEDLAEVEGLGKVTAQKIWDALRSSK